MTNTVTLEQLALEDQVRRITRAQAKINTRRKKGRG